MIEQAIAYVQQLLAEASFIDVFLAAFIEEVAFVIPSSVVQFGAGFFVMNEATHSAVSFLKLITAVALPIALGTILGSLFLYGLGYWFGKPLIEKFGRFFGVNWTQIEKVKAKMAGSSKDELTLFAARLIPIIPNTPVGIACGLIRYPLIKYIYVSFAGVFLRALIVGYVGWRAGASYLEHAEVVSRYEDWVLGALAVIVILVLIKARKYV